MKPDFVETSNVRNFHATLSEFEKRGAEEACFIVLDGEPGLGKTKTVNQWITQTGSLYLRAQIAWDYAWFIEAILLELNVEEIPRRRVDRFKLVMEMLQDISRQKKAEGQPFGIVIDEADMISTNRKIMETIRGISDLLLIPVVLVGMGKLRDHITRFKQIGSRAPHKVRFRKASLEDVKLLLSVKCEVPVADDLAHFLCKASGGYNREIMNAIANIERFGMRMDVDEGGLTIDDMSGQMLLKDRDSGNPILVPRVA